MNMAMLLTMGALLSGSAGAMGAPDANPGISVTGERGWEMICHVVAGGEPANRILDADRRTYGDPKLQRASCDYRNSTSAPLTISITAPSACPFKGASADQCALTVPKGRAGSFEFKVRR